MANPNGVGGFKPGMSGNPTGRPKSNDVIVALAQACTEEAIETLAAIMRDESKPTAARVSAATALLDRGYGKPSQNLTLSADAETPLITQIRMVIVSTPEMKKVTGNTVGEEVTLPPHAVISKLPRGVK